MRIALPLLIASSVCWPLTGAQADAKPAGQPTGPSTAEEAHQHFQRGVQFFREGSYDAALAEFGRAYEIAPNYRVLYNLGQVQVERQDFASALRYFRTYLGQGGGDIPAERRAQVEHDLEDLDNHVARVTIDVNVPGAEILLDQVPIGSAPLASAVLVNAGVRSVVVRKAGYASSTRLLTVVGGETSRFEVRIGREPDGVTRPDTAPRNAPVNRWPLWVGLGTTAALGATSATFAFFARRADTDLGALLEQYPADRDRINADRTREKTFSVLADAFGAGALVALGVSVYLAVSAGPSSTEPVKAGHARLQLRVMPSQPGVEVTGRF